VSAVVVLMLSGLPFNAPLKSVPFVSDAFTKLATSFSGGINVSGNGPITINVGLVDSLGNAILSVLNNSGEDLFVNQIVGPSGSGGVDFDGATVPSRGTVNFPLNLSDVCRCPDDGTTQFNCTYIVYFTDAHGNRVGQNVTVPMTCSSSGIDITPVIISQFLINEIDNPSMLDFGATSFNLGISTTKPATGCRYSKTPGKAYISMTNNFDMMDSQNFTVTISGLLPGDNIVYIKCLEESSGNANLNDYNVNIRTPLGGGTIADPWVINNATQLQAAGNHLNGNFALGGDINCSDTITWTYTDGLNNTQYGFKSIGDYGTPFTGTFDGRGYKIMDLYMNKNLTGYTAPFGSLGGTASISRVGFERENINDGSGQVAGGVFGFANCVNCLISQVYTTGTINAYVLVGGIGGSGVSTGGQSNLSIVDSYSTVNIISNGGPVGGILGETAGSGVSINRTYASGNLSGMGPVGGIIGQHNNSSTTNSFFSGTILINSGGGIIGLTSSASLNNTHYLSNPNYTCYNTNQTNPQCTPHDVVSYFYTPTNAPLDSFDGFGADKNWGICAGSSLPFLTWENRSC
ncbi:MAG: hypothetical protein NTY48_03110, partial [Candidatus Diapherotrites archaeon]|nr:hypothetical protein [Candidatus Diapherotrites archaeon]